MTIQGVHEIREAYRDSSVASHYIDARFLEPLGAMLHARQVAELRRAIRRARPRRILEIGPGPARLTVEVAKMTGARGVLVDASAAMLEQARRRLARVTRRPWALVHGDAFALPFAAARFDFVYSFRLIRHFEAAERRRLHAEIARVLRPGGTLVFDAVNEVVSRPLRTGARPDEYAHFDALHRADALRAEVEAAGFEVVSLRGAQRRYGLLRALQILLAPRSRVLARLAMEAVDRIGDGDPLEWIVTCRRRG